MKKYYKFAISIAILLMFPLTASADMVWPSLYVAQGLRSWYIILSGLIIEFLFVKLFTKQSWPKSLFISVVMNGISTLVGIVLIPVSGILGEFIMMPVDLVFDLYTFHSSHWVMAYIMVVVCNTAIEGLIIKIFKLPFLKSLPWLAIANAISVIICILSYGLTPNW